MSWILAGIGCVFSGLSYAELSSVIPSEGGTYAYAFVALGELPAIITAWCLTLEVWYGVLRDHDHVQSSIGRLSVREDNLFLV